MAETSIEIRELPPSPLQRPESASPKPLKMPSPRTSSNMVIDKTLSSAANLVKLLPSGTVLAFQILSPSFTNKGQCYPSNKVLTYILILICSLSCLFFSLTDTLRAADSKVYYGLATLKGFYVFNYDDDDEKCKELFKDSRRYRIRMLDVVHAIFTIVVFLALTFGDSDIQSCLFPDAGPDARELLVNLPLGAAVLSSLVFMTFPTSRKGIGYSDAAPRHKDQGC